jgi:predicted nuclease of predicted toxin-antitoxin system
MNKQIQEDWEELKVDKKDLNLLPQNPKKIKFLSDQNIPFNIIEELRSAKLSIISVAELRLSGHPDENIVEVAKKLRLVVLTTDKDFWDEKKHPIQKCFGIICIDAGHQETDKILKALALFDVYFFRYIPKNWWNKQKALIKTDGFILRQIIDNGSIQDNEYLIDKGKIYTRRLK